jgi:hypothetical protein
MAHPVREEGKDYPGYPYPQKGGGNNQGTEIGPAPHRKDPHYVQFIGYPGNRYKKQGAYFSVLHKNPHTGAAFPKFHFGNAARIKKKQAGLIKTRPLFPTAHIDEAISK